jgi:hypothetical protein
MPNEKDRKKKDGRNKGKKTKAMREAVQARKRTGQPSRPTTDEPDIQEFKPGAADDRTSQPQRRAGA